MIYICDNNGGFNAYWEEYCAKNKIKYEKIPFWDNDLVNKLRKGDAFLWHWHHSNPAEALIARQIIASLQLKGIKVFPDLNTCWHFDDKLGQKYLLEAAGLPLSKTWAFYSKSDALSWAKATTYPKVFKLRAGAGAKNVELVRSFGDAKKLINLMFGKGIPAANAKAQVEGTIKVFKKSPFAMFKKLNRIPHYINGILIRKRLPRQVGYAMFQEFIPGNKYDTRIIVIGNRAIGIRRKVRKNDFRASGSGMIEYERDKIDIECVKIGFDAAKRLKTQSLAFDFVRDNDGKYWIIEISYGFSVKAYYKCPGYWDETLIWHDSEVRPEAWIMEELLKNNLMF